MVSKSAEVIDPAVDIGLPAQAVGWDGIAGDPFRNGSQMVSVGVAPSGDVAPVERDHPAVVALHVAGLGIAIAETGDGVDDDWSLSAVNFAL